MNFSVTRFGKKLDESKYTWDERIKTFSTDEDNLVLDFTGINGVTFRTGYGCTFKTGSCCIFDTDSHCTFKTGSHCTFDTHSDCTFDTYSYCTFKTGSGCMFNTGSHCTFDTGFSCTFRTGPNCTFKTCFNCTFDTYHNCTFKTGKECVVIRRDIFEIIELKENQKIQLNGRNKKGYKVIDEKKTIIVDGKEVEISLELYEAIKKQIK